MWEERWMGLLMSLLRTEVANDLIQHFDKWFAEGIVERAKRAASEAKTRRMN